MVTGGAQLDDAERELLVQLVERLKRDLGAGLRQVLLYGSRARGEGRPDSDIDLLVIVQGEGPRNQHTVSSAAVELALDNDLPTPSAKVFGADFVEERRAIDSFFMQEVDRDAIQLYP